MATSLVVPAVLAAALIHSLWNLIAKTIPDQMAAFFFINLAAAICGAGLIGVFGIPPHFPWLYVVSSIVVHVIYNSSLMGSYKHGDLSTTYPLARGLAPVLVAIGAAIFDHELLSLTQIVGVAVIVSGLTSLVLVSRGIKTGRNKSLWLAGFTGVAISAYSLIDGNGTRLSHASLSYSGVVFLGEGLVVSAIFLVADRSLVSRSRITWMVGGAIGGVLSVTSYSIVLLAQVAAPLGEVSALRETSVVFGALLGGLFLKEGRLFPKLISAVIVSVGVSILVFSL